MLALAESSIMYCLDKTTCSWSMDLETIHEMEISKRKLTQTSECECKYCPLYNCLLSYFRKTMFAEKLKREEMFSSCVL